MSKFVLTAQLQLQAPTNVSQVVQQIQQQLQGVTVNIQAKGTAQAQKQIQQVAQAANQATTAAEKMGKAFALSVRRFAAFSIATRAVGLFTSTLSNAVETAIDFERQLIKVSQVTGKSIGQLRGLTKQITDLSTGFGVASSDLLNVSTVLAQAGLSAEDTSVALTTLAKAALAPNFDSISETAEGAIAILAQFQQGVGALEAQLGSINAVAGAFAVEASDLIDVVRRTGGVFKASGGSLNELLALFTSVRATTRESAESIGTGLRTIFTRIQRPKTIEFLKEFGVELVGLDGKFVGPYEAIKRLSGALAGLGEGDISFIRIAEELGGFRQIGKVLPLIQQFSTAQSALNVATKANDSLTQDAASAQAALAVRIMKVKEEFLALVRSVTETSTFQVMANTALSLASALIKIADAVKPLLPMLATLAAFKLVKGMGGFFGGIMNGATSGRAYNKGGKVLGFARGGLVPGSGNRDTVPAMLSPGEFVIRKSSVNKMGAGNLAAMNENRYATGGVAEKIAAARNQSGLLPKKQSRDLKSIAIKTPKFGKESEVGIATTSYLPSPAKTNITIDRESIADQSIGDLGFKLSTKYGKNALSYIKQVYKGKPNLSYNAVAEGVGLDEEKQFKTIIDESIGSAVDIASQRFATEILGSSLSKPVPKLQSFYNTLDGGFRGQLFENVITAMSGKPLSGQDSRRPFDFTRGIGKFKSIYSNLGMNYVDAKISSGAAGVGVKGFGTDGVTGLKTKILSQLAKEAIPAISLIERQAGETGTLTTQGKKAKKHFGGMIQKFAAGGGVGTDTVPALLTPGEFVVNRSSAQRIGYGNLNRMNKVGKYAKGGVVQHFAAGTSGTGAKSVVSDFNIPGFDTKAPTMLNKIIGKLTGTFSVTGATIDDANKQFRVLKAVVPNLSKSLVDYGNTNNISNKEMSQLSVAYSKLVMQMLRQGASSADIEANAQPYIDALKSGAKGISATARTSAVVPPPVPSSAGLSQTIEGVVPGFSKSLAANQIAWNRSTAEQDKLTSKIVENIAKWQSQGKSVDEMRGALEKFKDKLDRSTQRVDDALPSSAKTKNKYAQEALKNVKLDTGIGFRSSAEEALGTGRSKAEVAAERKAAMQAAGFTRGSERTKAILSGSQSTAPMTVADTIAAARGKSTSTSTSTTTGGSGPSGKPQGGGMGSMMGDNKMMGVSMASSLIQGFLPAVDESSSAMLKMTHNLLGLVTTIASVGFALEAFGLKLKAGDIMDFFSGKGGSLVNKAASYARAGTSAVGRGLTNVGGKLASQGGTVGKAGGMIGNLGTKVLGSVGGVGNAVTAIGKLAGPAALAAGAVYAFSSMIDSATDYQSKLNKAIEKGNVEQAGKMAVEKAGADAVNNVAMGMAALGSAIPVVGPTLAALAGAALKVASELPVIGPAVKSAAIWIGTLFGGKNEASIKAMAESSAQAARTTKALEQGQKDASKAMEDFKNGSISATEALNRIQGMQESVNTLGQKTSDAIDKNNTNKGGTLREIGAWATLGYMDSNAERNKKIDTENAAQNKTFIDAQRQSFAQSSELRNASIRSTLARGGSQEDAAAKLGAYDPNKLRAQAVAAGEKAMKASKSGDEATADAYIERQKLLIEQAREVESAMENIAKEVQRAKDSFEAMNLGLRSATATSTALSAGMSRFSSGLDVGGSTFVDDVEFLQQSLSSAAQAMDPSDIKDAMKNVSANLSEFGVSPEYIKKFEGNVSAFTQAQANYNKAFENVKKSIAEADFKNLSADQLKAKMADELTQGMGPDVSDEAKKNLKAVIANMELSDADVNKIIGGDLSAFGDKLTEEQKKMFEDVQKIAQDRAKAEQVLIDFTKRRIDAERNLVEAQKEALDLVMEGRDIEAKYGGQAVTAEERRSNLLAKSNVEGSRLGLTNMTTGDAGELRRRNAEIRQSFSNIEDKRSQRGGLQGKRGVEADETQKDLQKAYKTQIETIRGLIKLEEDQLKITQEKNKLEKESMESLVKGDVEEFFKKQSAVGATAAIASGDERLMRLYGADALGTAAMDVQRQQEAGVQELYGQQLAGPGGLTEAAAGAALSARGVTDMRAAQVMAGTTAEEEASKARLRELGGMLGETGQLGSEMAEMQVQTATINVNSAELKFNETMNRGKEAAKEANRAENMPAVAKARGGLIYANRGIFVPRGTDTVPAMLTPGEFVVNRSAVQRGNNLQILHAMNGGAGVSNTSGGSAAMSTGGRVRYFSDGGETGGAGGGGGMFDNISKFISAMSTFSTNLSSNIEKLTNTSLSIKLDATNVNININDGGLLSKIKDETKAELFKKIQNELVAGEGGRLIENRMR